MYIISYDIFIYTWHLFDSPITHAPTLSSKGIQRLWQKSGRNPNSIVQRQKKPNRGRERRFWGLAIFVFLSKFLRAMSQSSVLPDDLYTRTYMQYFPAHYFTVTALRTYKQRKKCIKSKCGSNRIMTIHPSRSSSSFNTVPTPPPHRPVHSSLHPPLLTYLLVWLCWRGNLVRQCLSTVTSGRCPASWTDSSPCPKNRNMMMK